MAFLAFHYVNQQVRSKNDRKTDFLWEFANFALMSVPRAERGFEGHRSLALLWTGRIKPFRQLRLEEAENYVNIREFLAATDRSTRFFNPVNPEILSEKYRRRRIELAHSFVSSD